VSIYGPLVTDTAVERAVLASLRGWLPSYLAEVARQDGSGAVTTPASYEAIRDTVTKWPEQALPAIVVQVGGTLQTTRKGSNYRAVYGASVGCIVAGPTRTRTRELAGIYGLAVTAALTQHGDLGGFADGVDWTDTIYDLIDEDRSRTLMAAVVSLDVAVNNVLDVAQGPTGPTPDPDDDPIPGLPNWGNADDVETDILIVPIGDPLP
jgi:hypothetical protein